jgi:DNA-binding beta-propeller fold protein YncE
MPITQMIAGRTFTYMECMGRNGAGETGFIHPVGIARGKDNVIYILNAGTEFLPSARITKATLEHEWLMDIGSPGNGDGQFLWPGGIALDSHENIYVTDQIDHKVVVFDNGGTSLGTWGSYGTNREQFHAPSGIAIDSDDNVFIVDSRNDRVQKFSTDGKHLGTFGASGKEDGQFTLPWGITIDSSGDIYIADWGNDRIQKFTSEGQHLLTFGISGNGPGEMHRPSGVAVDPDGDIYVADMGNDRALVFTPEGDHLATFVGDARELSPWARLTVDVNPDVIKARARTSTEPEVVFRGPVAINAGDDFRVTVVEAFNNRLQFYLKDKAYEDPQFTL